MTNKDWILLAVPILANGVLVFILQFYLHRFYNKKDEKNKLKTQEISDTISALENIQKPLYTLTHHIDPSEFTGVFNEAQYYMHEFKRLNDVANHLISIGDGKIQTIFNDWDVLCSTLRTIRSNNGGVITDEYNAICSEILKKVYENISKLIKEYKNEYFS